jgi:hypothetical protein
VNQAFYLLLEGEEPLYDLLDGDGDYIIPQTIEDTLKSFINTLLPLVSDSLHDELLEQIAKFGSMDDLAGMTIDSAITRAIGEWKPDMVPQYSTKDKHGFQLYQNFPNPFSNQTSIKYLLKEEGHIELTIYNTTGQKIVTLVRDRKPAGKYSVIWNGKDQSGEEVAKGIYCYQIKVGQVTETRKMILVR